MHKMEKGIPGYDTARRMRLSWCEKKIALLCMMVRTGRVPGGEHRTELNAS